MCGVAGFIALAGETPFGLGALELMNELLRHRGPDGMGTWLGPGGRIGLAHRRLAVVDVGPTGAQPMLGRTGGAISFNGEIYNHRELRAQDADGGWRGTSDTEVALRLLEAKGADALPSFRGMFALAFADARDGSLLLARDRFGVKPLYYATTGGTLIFASEIKALLPFLDRITTDRDGLKDYLAFQTCLEGKTLFDGVKELPPGHILQVRDGRISLTRYWEIWFRPDFHTSAEQFHERLRDAIATSVSLHLRSDVPVGAYVSGGVDSSLIALLAAEAGAAPHCFHGRFDIGPEFDESRYAQDVARRGGMPLDVVDITPADFSEHIARIIYHLDQPTAGPGAFPQFMVAQLASRQRKVVLGGQGGDEIFGGYVRYLLAYFEQCIKAAIDGTSGNGSFIVTYESIIPNLGALKNYKPLIQEFWREGLFDSMDRRYFRLVNRANGLAGEVRWDQLGSYDPFDSFSRSFHTPNVGKQSYFDQMTHFDFKTLLPALLQVEDRMSMAHGVESRVPLLDHPLVELAATMPADVKFAGGSLKLALKRSFPATLPDSVMQRDDKMGFPTPFVEWMRGPLRPFAQDILGSAAARSREFFDNGLVLAGLDSSPKFSRHLWGMLSLELWQRTFHDRAGEIRRQGQAALANKTTSGGIR